MPRVHVHPPLRTRDLVFRGGHPKEAAFAAHTGFRGGRSKEDFWCFALVFRGCFAGVSRVFRGGFVCK
jgi:hypothetical protein